MQRVREPRCVWLLSHESRQLPGYAFMSRNLVHAALFGEIGQSDEGSFKGCTLIVKRIVSVFKAGGIVAVLNAASRRARMPHARSFRICRQIVTEGTGLEIGGPSPIFAWGGLISVYPVANKIDNVNFASRTIWNGDVIEADSFTFDSRKAPGRQFIAEGADLSAIHGGDYDFVLSSHMLEHTANILGALTEWKRVLKPGGGLILVVPARDCTFDHRRPITTMLHLVEDFEGNMGEDDLTHLVEVLQLHDLSREAEIIDVSTFRK
jgi:SAM-dependent methyltransferase